MRSDLKTSEIHFFDCICKDYTECHRVYKNTRIKQFRAEKIGNPCFAVIIGVTQQNTVRLKKLFEVTGIFAYFTLVGLCMCMIFFSASMNSVVT